MVYEFEIGTVKDNPEPNSSLSCPSIFSFNDILKRNEHGLKILTLKKFRSKDSSVFLTAGFFHLSILSVIMLRDHLFNKINLTCAVFHL